MPSGMAQFLKQGSLFSRVRLPLLSQRRPGKAARTTDAVRLLIVAVVIVVAWALQFLPALRSMEDRLYDWRIRVLAGQHVVSPQVLLVAIDEASLRALEPAVGRWPWPRAVLASVVDYCSEARVVALDVLLPEGDWQYQRSDEVLVDTAAQRGNVVNAIHMQAVLSAALPHGLSDFALDGESWDGLDLREYGSALVPFRGLLKAGVGVGHVNPVLDQDGVSRMHAAVVKADGRAFPSLALAAVMCYQGVEGADVVLDDRGNLCAGELVIPIDSRGRFRLCPSRWEYERYRIADVIRSWQAEGDGGTTVIGREAFRGKIVLVGSLATGLLEDRKVTPLSAETGGVEIITAAVESMLSGRYVKTAEAWSLVFIAVLALVPASRRLARPSMMVGGLILVGFLYGVVCLSALVSLLWMLPLVGPLLGLLLSGVALGSVSWYEERAGREVAEELDRAKQRLTDMVVHDLRNALSPVVSALSVAESGNDDEFLHELFLPIVRDSSDMLLCQINSLLDIRRLQDGKLEVSKHPVSILRLLREIEMQYGLVARRAEKEIRVAPSDSTGLAVEADERLLERVFQNLAWNAIRYAAQRTAIEIDATPEPEGRGVEVHVRNHCRTIPGDQLECLFEPFAVGPDAVREGRWQSMGLGLAFCKLAVEAMGGAIRIDSPAEGWDDGVQVTLVLPGLDEDRDGS